MSYLGLTMANKLYRWANNNIAKDKEDLFKRSIDNFELLRFFNLAYKKGVVNIIASIGNENILIHAEGNQFGILVSLEYRDNYEGKGLLGKWVDIFKEYPNSDSSVKDFCEVLFSQENSLKELKGLRKPRYLLTDIRNDNAVVYDEEENLFSDEFTSACKDYCLFCYSD